MLKLTDWAALAADFLTFAGGIILAADAIMAVQHFKEEERRVKTLKSFLGKVRLETEDRHAINNENDVHLISIRRLARWAIFGATVLVGGYLLQLITRVVEISKK